MALRILLAAQGQRQRGAARPRHDPPRREYQTVHSVQVQEKNDWFCFRKKLTPPLSQNPSDGLPPFQKSRKALPTRGSGCWFLDKMFSWTKKTPVKKAPEKEEAEVETPKEAEVVKEKEEEAAPVVATKEEEEDEAVAAAPPPPLPPRAPDPPAPKEEEPKKKATKAKKEPAKKKEVVKKEKKEVVKKEKKEPKKKGKKEAKKEEVVAEEKEPPKEEKKADMSPEAQAQRSKEREKRLERYEAEILQAQMALSSQRDMWEQLVKDSRAQVSELRRELDETRVEVEKIRTETKKEIVLHDAKTRALTDGLVRHKLRTAEISADIDTYRHAKREVQKKRDLTVAKRDKKKEATDTAKSNLKARLSAHQDEKQQEATDGFPTEDE